MIPSLSFHPLEKQKVGTYALGEDETEKGLDYTYKQVNILCLYSGKTQILTNSLH